MGQMQRPPFWTPCFGLGVLLVASSAFAQGVPVPSNSQAPSAPQLFSPKSVTPFPEGLKVGFIDFQVVAQESASGKAATLQLKALQNIKFAEIEKKDKALQALQAQR